MNLFQTPFSAAMFFSVVISLSSSYSPPFFDYPVAPGICGGYCTGGRTPCWAHVNTQNFPACEWAHDNCCPPAGDGSQWTTTTTINPNACGGYCVTGISSWGDCWDFKFNQQHEEHQRCLWAFQNCCPPNGDGSQWTTTTTTTTEKNEDAGKLATWVIVVIAVGAVLLVAILVGVGICFCVYFNGQKRKRRVNPGGDATPAYGYPGTGARPGLYQPVIQPQSQFTNDSPFYA